MLCRRFNIIIGTGFFTGAIAVSFHVRYNEIEFQINLRLILAML